MRRKLLTASHFGRICKKREKTSCTSIVKQIVYPREFKTDETEYGKNHESIAREEFAKLKNVCVQECGLFIDENLGFLGASPYGLI